MLFFLSHQRTAARRSRDGQHLPIHVHIINGDGRAKVNMEPEIEVVSNNGIKPKDIKKALVVIETYRDDILNAWREYHGE